MYKYHVVIHRWMKDNEKNWCVQKKINKMSNKQWLIISWNEIDTSQYQAVSLKIILIYTSNFYADEEKNYKRKSV